MSAHAIRRAETVDLPHIAMVARTTWPVAYAGIVPDAIQRRLLDEWYSPESLGWALAARGSSFFVAESAHGVVPPRSTYGARRCRSS